MKGDLNRPLLGLQIGLALSGAVARLALPLAMLGLARGARETALVAATVASVCTILRGFLAWRATQLALSLAWSAIASAACARPVEALPRRREDEESVSSLLDGVQEEATFASSHLPQAGALAIAGAGVVVAAIVVLGPLSILVGVVLLVLGGGLTSFLGRGLRRHQDAAWSSFGSLSRTMRLLLEGAVELRATGRQETVARDVVEIAGEMGKHQAHAAATGARLAILPASVALLALALPFWGGIQGLALLLGERLFQASIIGASALSTAFSASQVWQQGTSSAPRRARYRAFVEAGRAQPSRRKETPPAGSLSELPIVFDGFGRDWNHDGVLTPRNLRVELPVRGGVAFVGPNGSGKSTAALALLGVVSPTQGLVTIGGKNASELDWSTWGPRIGYVPQDPLLVPGASIEWHCRLHESTASSKEAVDEALRRVGLDDALISRARARRLEMRDLPAGELSGGERRRMALARALLRPRELYVFDEPEAALDSAARAALVDTLTTLATTARVILVAHDKAAIPPGFTVVRFDR